MRKLFRICLFSFLLFFGTVAAQNNNPFEFAIKGGLNLSTIGGNTISYDVKPGLNIGFTMERMLSDYLFFITGLEFTMKGGKAIENEELYFSYVQIPVHWGVKASIQENAKIFFHLGPYFAYAVEGELKGDNESYDAFESYNGMTPYSKFDAGLGLAAGIEVNRCVFTLGYDFGLVNLDDDMSTMANVDDLRMKNQNLYLTFGYKF